jgi:hypothetical protein
MTNSFKNNIAAQVVNNFLLKLTNTDIDPEVRARLEQAILEEEKVSEVALRVAIFDGSKDD